jgi:hypothetical protein
MPTTPEEQLERNLHTWHGLCAEDPEAKEIVGKPYKGTSPRPMHMVKKMTAAFGPIGVGWGYEIKDRWSEDIPDLDTGAVHCVMVFVKVHLYLINSSPSFWETIGSCKKVYLSKGQNARLVVDDDAYKKATTDALTKGLSHIGVCANTYGLQTDAEPEELGTPQRNVGHELNDYLRARCKDLGIDPEKRPGTINKILAELGIPKRIDELLKNKEKIIDAIGKWTPPKDGEFDDPKTPNPAKPDNTEGMQDNGGREGDKPDGDDEEWTKILRYMHGAVSSALEVDGDTAHRYLHSALPGKFEGKLERVKNMEMASALVQRTINLVTTGKPVKE